jgi:hypothetical protein
MEESTLQMNLEVFIEMPRLRGSSPLHIILQQNGVAKRKNRTIMEAIMTMIHDQDLPMHLWVEASRTTICVKNKLSHSALGCKTSGEMFTEKKPKVSHLKIFGCLVFVHIPKEKRTKEIREFLLDTVRSLRRSKFTYQVTIILRSIEM